MINKYNNFLFRNESKVNELFENVNEFIPFELREKIDPDFKWTKENEDKAYYTGNRGIMKSINKSKDYLEKMKRLLIGNTVKLYHFDYEHGEYDEPIEFVVGSISYNMLGVIHLVAKSNEWYSAVMDERKPIKIKMKKRVFNELDPYGEEDWDDENESKVNELFETEKTYDYKFVKSRKMAQFTDVVFTFTSRDKVEYFVTISINHDQKYMSVKFTDKSNFKGLRNKIKDKYVNLENYDAINVLNTVVKICKDFYDKNKEFINSFTTSTLDEKRLRIYKYILSKYFVGWEVSSYVDPRGDIVIDAEPKKINEAHEDIDPYGEEDWEDSKEINIGDDVICIKTYATDRIKRNRIYKVVDILDGGYRNRYLKVKGIDYFWFESRFKKINLNESHEDVDPYGEEDWDDENEIKVGDTIMCMDNQRAYGIKIGNTYKVLDFDHMGDPKIINDAGKGVYYCKWRFKKKPLNESHEDIDPYGEEDWDNENEIEVGDTIMCMDNQLSFHITVGKIYKVKRLDSVGDIYLENDQNKETVYCKWRFKKVKK